MIDVYTWPTPNGHKVHIMLEEVGLPYTVQPVNIRSGEQFDEAFLAISPNNKIPAIVDQRGPEGKPYRLMESGAILLYLSGKTGLLMPEAVSAKYDVLQWLMFQMEPRDQNQGFPANAARTCEKRASFRSGSRSGSDFTRNASP